AASARPRTPRAAPPRRDLGLHLLYLTGFQWANLDLRLHGLDPEGRRHLDRLGVGPGVVAQQEADVGDAATGHRGLCVDDDHIGGQNPTTTELVGEQTV